jgi:long-chain fatty acid transport protein
MKKTGIILMIGLMLMSVVFGGGIVTNTNQSAEFMRTLNRNASLGLDAAYYNPAGLTQLGDGFYAYVSNQTIFQTRTIESSSSALSPLGFPLHDEYVGETMVPFYPNIYLIHKMDNLAIAGGLTVIGGGGTATYDDGLASFEALALDKAATGLGYYNLGPSGYAIDAEFDGASTYLGFQGEVAYAVNEMVSLAVGARYVMATNKYEGSLDAVFDVYPPDNQILGPVFPYLVEVDVEQTGTAVTPFFGLNLIPTEGVNIGFRYEHLTSLELENNTTEDGTGMFPDGAKTQADIPAMVAAGVSYQASDAVSVEGDFTYYLNTGADWEEDREDHVDNGYEAGAALEFAVSDVLSVSGGVLYSVSGAKDEYQTDRSYSLDSFSIAAGVEYDINDSMTLNVGVFDVIYTEGERSASAVYPVMDTFNKTSYGVGIGIGYKIK